MNLENRCNEYASFLEDYLKNCYANWEKLPQQKLYESMFYSLFAGGKRLRPVLTFEFCRMCGQDWKKAAPFAAALEMVHTYSLIHDDLPCMDNDDYRRGRLTNHKVYGEALACLAGDALLTDAFGMMAKADLPNPKYLQTAIGILSNCAGSNGMVGGQVLDILSEERICTEQEVLDIQSRKTGALIRAACCLGVIAGGGGEEQLSAAGKFAELLGLAFQIRDDILDVIGNAQELGKAVGMDGEKNTFVRLYGLQKAETLVEDYTRQAIVTLGAFPDIQWITQYAQSLTGRTH